MSHTPVYLANGRTSDDRAAAFAKLPQEMRSILASQCSGSTTRPHDIDLLYAGPVCALIRYRPSSYSDNGGTHYCSGWIVRVVIGQGRHRGDELSREENVFHSGKGVRFTPSMLDKLVEETKAFEVEYPKLRAAKDAREIAHRDLCVKVRTEAEAQLAAIITKAVAAGWTRIETGSWDEEVKFGSYSSVALLFGMVCFERAGLRMVMTCREKEADVLARGTPVWRVESLAATEALLDGLTIDKALAAPSMPKLEAM